MEVLLQYLFEGEIDPSDDGVDLDLEHLDDVRIPHENLTVKDVFYAC